MKKHKKEILCFMLVFAVLLSGCSVNYRNSTAADRYEFLRDTSAVDYSGILSTPWDVEAAGASIGVQDTKAYTVMIYMNGSDLESVGGAATADLLEILNSGVDTGMVNIIIFTGGTVRWQNNVIPSNECMVWQIKDGNIDKIAGVGLVNMGDPGTLASFINFGLSYYPAQKYGLIFWDHGGGSIAGYGHDEIFNHSCLTLLEMEYAFLMSGLADNRLEFLGFDACLMATVEMAVVASNYAGYLVASEDVEPGDGWDYSFLSVLNDNPGIDGASLGAEIADYYMSYYGWNADSGLTMSVIDLSNAGFVMGAMGNLMNRCTRSLVENRESSYITLAKRRDKTKTFGAGSGRDNNCDMVDIGDMASKLSDLYPNETADLLAALNNSVVYNRNNSLASLGGLAAYYIFAGKYDADNTLKTYASLSMSGEYTEYLQAFARILTGDGIQSDFSRSADTGVTVPDEDDLLLGACLMAWKQVPGTEGSYFLIGKRSAEDMVGGVTLNDRHSGLWPAIDGVQVCMDEIDRRGSGTVYAIPVRTEGGDASIIVLVSEEYPDGKILGLRREEGYIIQKGFDEIADGDKICFYYRMKDFSRGGEDPDKWYIGDEVTVKGELKLDWLELGGNQTYYYSFCLTDTQLNGHYTGLMTAA